MSEFRARRKEKTQVDFTEGEILKPVVLFALPILFGGVFSALYNVVDSMVVGQFVGSSALAAVNASFVVTTVCIAVYAGFGSGSAVLVGQLFGAKQFEKLGSAVSTAFIGALVVGITMSIVGILISAPLLRLINTPEEIMADATLYLRIFMIGCTTEIFYYMGSAMLRGLGDSRSPMYYMIFCSILNIVLDLVFVALFGWGCAGVALATVFSQLASAILVVHKILTGDYGFHLTRQSFRLDWDILRRILRIGVPSAIQDIVAAVGLLFVQSYANSFGTNFVAVNGIVQKMETFTMLSSQSIGQTISTFTAQNLGAGKRERVLKGNRISLTLTFLVALGIGVLLFTCAPLFIRLFINSNDPGFDSIMIMGTTSLQILAFFYSLYALQYGFYSVMQGAGATRPAMIIAIACIVFRVPLTYFMAMGTGQYQFLYWATNIYNTVFMVAMFMYYKFGHWEKFVQVKKGENTF